MSPAMRESEKGIYGTVVAPTTPNPNPIPQMPKIDSVPKGYIETEAKSVTASVPSTYITSQPGGYIADVGSQEPLTPKQEATVQAYLQTPEGYQLESVQEQAVRTSMVPGTGREGTPTGETQFVATYKPTPQPLGLGESGYVATQVAENVLVALTGGKGTLQETLIRAELNPLYFAVGSTGTIESDILGIASIPTSIAASISKGKLVYQPALNVKTSPTVIGSAISPLFGGAEGEEFESRPLAYRLGAAFGEAGFMVISSEATSRLWTRIRGVKVGKLSGATETELTKGTGTGIETQRATRLLLEEQRVSPSEAAKLREFARYTTPERVALGGTQVRFEQYIDDTVRIASKSAEAFREASPYVETAGKAASTESGILRSIGQKLGIVKPKTVVAGAIAKNYVDDLAEYSSKAVGVAQGGKGLVYSTEKIVGSQVLYPYGVSAAEKTFTGAYVVGKIDTQVYLGLVKAVGPEVAQKWYPQMGGLAPQLLQKAAPEAVTVTTKVISVAAPASLAANVAKGVLVASIPKVLPKQKKPQLITPITLETEPATKAVPLATALVTETREQAKPTVQFAPITTWNRMKPKIAVPSLTTLEKPSPTLSERLNDFVVQKPSQKPSQIPSLTPILSTRQKQSIAQIVETTQETNVPNIPFPKSASNRNFAAAMRNLGGGGGGRRSGGFDVGKWFKKRHPVATLEQNVRFAVGGSFKKQTRHKRSKKKRRKR